MIIVDYSQVVISNFMVEVGGRKDIDVSVPLLRHMILNTIRSYNKKHRNEFGEMIIACDSWKYWRREHFPFYKGNRKKQRDASGIDWETLFEALKLVKKEINEYLPWRVVEAEGAEADDVIATLCEWAQENYLKETALFDPEPKPILIVSGDGDFVQLQRWGNIKQFSPITKKFLKADRSPDYVVMEHIIKGDAGDGVPNVLSADNCIVDGVRQSPVMTKKMEQWIADPSTMPQDDNFKRNFARNKLMVDLSMIPADVKNRVIETFTAQPKKDRSQLLNYFIKNKMSNMLEVASDF